MNAPPGLLPNENQLKLNSINCYNHPNNQLVGVCNDKNCGNKDKFMCLDCIFESHSGHVGIKSNVIEEIYKQNFYNYAQKNKILNNEYIKFEKNLKSKIDEIKNKINRDLDQLYNNILKEIKNANNKINNLEEMNIIKNNYPPKNKEELNKLIDGLIKLYNNKNNINYQEDKLLIEKKFNDYESIFQEKMKSLENFISNFTKIKLEQFEWSTITYGSYGFYYKLEENNSKVTKVSNGGTISICRGIKPLQKGNKYKLDYYINYINGDFDIGFGDDNVGRSCWLRGNNSYSISSFGININGNNFREHKIKKENKKITFIIDLKNNISEIFIDDQKIYNFNIASNLIYYPMIAIRELNNSVKLNLTEII